MAKRSSCSGKHSRRPWQKNSHPPRFEINAAVVFRLGEELITDVVQALVELVKNSYDADATWVNVTIDTHAKEPMGTGVR